MMNTLKIVFENDQFLIIDKPTGLPVYAGAGTVGKTLVDFLGEYMPDSELQAERFGLVHRLDKDTSGLLLVAKTAQALGFFRDSFKKRQVQKTYLALVQGKLSSKRGLIDIPLARDMVKKTLVTASAKGKAATTKYEVLDYLQSSTYVSVMPETGRTHQIRVHFSLIGHPILGDVKYGKPASHRLFLHAHELAFKDLIGQEHKFVSPLPVDLAQVLKNTK